MSKRTARIDSPGEPVSPAKDPMIPTDRSAEEKRSVLEARKQRKQRVRNAVGLVVLIGAVAWSTGHVFYHSFLSGGGVLGGGENVVRFAHWQLEGRTVQALDRACRDYERLQKEKFGREVRVEQIEVPERGYQQWVKTQLIGRTAPDLIELRPWEWRSLINRYFTPLSAYIDEPNPYNAGTDLAVVPWRETYIDGMQGGWIQDLQAYYGIPLCVFTVRIFANEQLIAAATGGDVTPPETLREFFSLCEQIEAYAERTGNEELVPIAGSDYTATWFKERYMTMALYGMAAKYDTDHDDYVGEMERLRAVAEGELDFRTDQHVRAAHQVLYDISRYFNRGFTSATRDQSVRRFAQGTAAMIATGTWDAGSFLEEIGDDFNIIVFDFPVAAPDNPKYGEFIPYRKNEADVRTGFVMGLTKISAHKDRAVDFMRFVTSREYNEELNNRFRWFPAIVGAETLDFLEAFRPRTDGVPEVFKMFIGADTRFNYESKFQGFVSEDVLAGHEGEDYQKLLDEHYQEFISAYAEDFAQYAYDDFHRKLIEKWGSIANNEGSLAQARARAMRAGMDGRGKALAGEPRRFYKTLLFGQAKAIQGRASNLHKLEKIRRIAEEGGE